MIGQRFGRLVVIAVGPVRARAPGSGRGGGRKAWLCRCDCGADKTVADRDLRAGSSQSCGCLRRELSAARLRTHGHTVGGRSPTYESWSGMVKRCRNPNDPWFHRYGGRGITVCERWETSFENFLADVGERPSKAHTIDRIDGEKGYEPSNVRWSTWGEQNRHLSRNRTLTFRGKTLVLADWATEIGVPAGALGHRLAAGWSVERTLTTPPRKDRRRDAREAELYELHRAPRVAVAGGAG